MRKPQGYATIIGPNQPRGMAEHDVVTCIHCGHVDMTRASLSGKLEILIFRADGTHYLREAGFCRNCYNPICPRCEGQPCSNRFRRLDEEEKLARRFQCL